MMIAEITNMKAHGYICRTITKT